MTLTREIINLLTIIRNKVTYFLVILLLATACQDPDSNIAQEVETEWERPIFVVVATFNNVNYCDKNIESILLQKYDNFRVVVIDDGSTDGTGNRIQKRAEEIGKAHKLLVRRNKKNTGSAMANIYAAITELAHDDEIVVTVDGDDWLAHDEVFAKLNRIYANEAVWVTYGAYDYIESSGRREGLRDVVPNWVLRHGEIRQQKWVTSHLRTFYAGLFKQIDKSDLYFDGEFAKVAWDLGFMFPLIEMAATHVYYNPDVSYLYNVIGQDHDHVKHAQQQQKVDRYFRRKPPYQPLVELPFSRRSGT